MGTMVEFILSDRSDKIMAHQWWVMSATSVFHLTFSTPGTTPPYKLTACIANETIKIPLEFQFSDVSIPR
jgi:hypothetical protein